MKVRSLVGVHTDQAQPRLSHEVPLNPDGTALTWETMTAVCPVVPLDQGLVKSEQVRAQPGADPTAFLKGEVVVQGTWPSATLRAQQWEDTLDSFCLVYICLEGLQSRGTLSITCDGGQVVRMGQLHSAWGIKLGALLVLDEGEQFWVEQRSQVLFSYRWTGEELEQVVV